MAGELYMRVGEDVALGPFPAANIDPDLLVEHVIESPDTLRKPPSTEAAPSRTCEVCGDLARVLTLDGYANGTPIRHRFCLACATETTAQVLKVRPRVRLTTLLAMAGLAMLVVGLFGDSLIPQGHSGFGWHQQLGLGLGVLLAFFGLLLRADVVMLAGGFILAAALTADWFGLTRGPGIGWKQQWLICAGLAFLLVALVGRSRRRLGAVLSRHMVESTASDTPPAGQLATE